MKLVAVHMLLLVVLIFPGCKDDGGPPPVETKDPRTYSWTVDTISYPGSFQTLMTRMWASGPDNVYIVGHNDQAFGKMFHFDGLRWTDVRLNQSQGGTISPPIGTLYGIFGFAPNDVWAVGERNGDPPARSDSSVIIHFDGVQWREYTIHPRRGHRLQSLWGAAPNDIWAAGTNTLVHFDGVQWSHFPIEMPVQRIQFLSIAGINANDVFMIGWREDVTRDNDTMAYLLYRAEQNVWSVADSSVRIQGTPQPKFGVALKVIDRTLYSLDQGIFRLSCSRPFKY